MCDVSLEYVTSARFGGKGDLRSFAALEIETGASWRGQARSFVLVTNSISCGGQVVSTFQISA